VCCTNPAASLFFAIHADYQTAWHVEVLPKGHPLRRPSLRACLTLVHSALHPMAVDTDFVGLEVLKNLLQAHKVRLGALGLRASLGAGCNAPGSLQGLQGVGTGCTNTHSLVQLPSSSCCCLV